MKKITLAAIIGNEEAVIERFIRSFAPAVDSIYLTVATGTELRDRTLMLATGIAEQLGVDLAWSVFGDSKFPHVSHFGNARQQSWLDALMFNADYLLWADADDILAPGAAEQIRAAAESDSRDVYIMPYDVKGNGKQIVHRERLIRASVGSYWKHAVHESLEFPRDVTYRMIPATFIHSPLAEKTGSHERNLNILRAELEDVPRNLFYLAQESFNHGDDIAFKTAATTALDCRGLGDLERYELLLELAQTPGNDSRKLAAEAFAIMPDRREALALLSNYCIVDGDYPKALLLAERMIATPRPSRTYWSQNEEWYGWKATELHNQCLRLNEKPILPRIQEGRDATGEVVLTSYAQPVFSIIHATLDRPEKALQIREMWLSRARHPENVEYIFGMHEWDAKSIRCLKGFRHTITSEKGAAKNWDTAAGAATGQIIVQAQDDCYPPDGWDETLLAMIPDPSVPVFVGPFDGFRQDRLWVNQIITRPYMAYRASLETDGGNGFYHRGYTGAYCDTEVSLRAIQDADEGLVELIDARDFTIYHDHPLYNPGVIWDATYAIENNPANYAQGGKLFFERNGSAAEDCLHRKESA